MTSSRFRLAAPLLATLLLAACTDAPPQALGTLEYDRITLPATAAERIVAIDVHEGDTVTDGQVLLRLEAARAGPQAEAAQAEAQAQAARLEELEAGARTEDIAQARAALAAAQAQSREASAQAARFEALGRRQLVARADVDRTRAARDSAAAQVRQAQAVLAELEHGTRGEQVAAGAAAVRAAQAQAKVQTVTLGKLTVAAPRAGRVDSLPYKLGDQAPVGAPLAILLVGPAPHARIYVPEPMRARVKVGDAARVFVDGRDGSFAGRVRTIRNEPSFTPYYALIGKDAARLSYLAEIELGADAADLPAGLPVRVEFGGAAK
jgi:HlyD family secretion protein